MGARRKILTFGGGGGGGISRSQVILSVLYIFWFEGGTSHKNP